MNKPYFKIKKLSDDVIVPSKRDEDAGFDIYGIFEEDFIVLDSGEIKMIPTGFSMEIPKDWVFLIKERGSTGSKGISVRCGIIDSGFRGELFIALNNTSKKTIVFYKEDWGLETFLESQDLKEDEVTIYPQTKAIAQGLLLYTPHVDVKIVNEISESERKDKILGSTNK
jgi:dUTP pyrophosphatase